MNDDYPVKWTLEARDSLEELLRNILIHFGLKVAKKVDLEIQKHVKLIEKNNELCPVSKIVDIRKCVVSKQTSLIYRIRKNYVELLAFIPNSSNHSY